MLLGKSGYIRRTSPVALDVAVEEVSRRLTGFLHCLQRTGRGQGLTELELGLHAAPHSLTVATCKPVWFIHTKNPGCLPKSKWTEWRNFP